MKKFQDSIPSVKPAETGPEIDAAAKRLSVDWVLPGSRQRSTGASQIVQRLAHGRLHSVALEIKRPPRRIVTTS